MIKAMGVIEQGFDVRDDDGLAELIDGMVFLFDILNGGVDIEVITNKKLMMMNRYRSFS